MSWLFFLGKDVFRIFILCYTVLLLWLLVVKSLVLFVCNLLYTIVHTINCLAITQLVYQTEYEFLLAYTILRIISRGTNFLFVAYFTKINFAFPLKYPAGLDFIFYVKLFFVILVEQKQSSWILQKKKKKKGSIDFTKQLDVFFLFLLFFIKSYYFV